MKSLNGKIYLTNTGELYIKDCDGNYHGIISSHFNPLGIDLKNIYNMSGDNINHDIEKRSQECFYEFIIKNGLYTLIDKELIYNKIIY